MFFSNLEFSPSDFRRGRGGSGFTILEILLSLAIMALLAGVLVTGSVALIGDKPATPEDVFWKAVVQCRAAALATDRDVRLSFDAKEKNFVVDDGGAVKTLSVPGSKDLTIDFLAAQSARSTVLIGGELVDTQSLPFVTFYADGTCSPFRAQFRNGGAARFLAIDPWTCARVLPKEETP